MSSASRDQVLVVHRHEPNMIRKFELGEAEVELDESCCVPDSDNGGFFFEGQSHAINLPKQSLVPHRPILNGGVSRANTHQSQPRRKRAPLRDLRQVPIRGLSRMSKNDKTSKKESRNISPMESKHDTSSCLVVEVCSNISDISYGDTDKENRRPSGLKCHTKQKSTGFKLQSFNSLNSGGLFGGAGKSES